MMKDLHPKLIKFALKTGLIVALFVWMFLTASEAVLGHVRPIWLESDTGWKVAPFGFVAGALAGGIWWAIKNPRNQD